MSLYIGNSKVADTASYGLWFGGSKIKEAYLGSQLVYKYKPYAPSTVLFEKAVAGTYTLNVIGRVKVSVIMVGAGGGGGSSHFMVWERGRNGGQGSMISGNIYLDAGSYSITVGAAGIGHRKSDGSGSGAGTAGGSTTFLGNTAGGGSGSEAHTGYYDGGWERGGDGGKATVVTSGLTGSNGANTSTASKYGSYGGGGVGNSSTAGNGQVGYCKITAIGY